LKPSAKRRLERVSRSFSEAGPPERLKLRLAGQPSDVLRLPTKIGITSKTATHRITRHLRQRLRDQSERPCSHTAKFRPYC